MVTTILKRFFEVYLRHRWLYLLPFVILLIAGGASYVLNKPKYVSTGVIFVQKESLLASLNSVGNSNTNIWTTAAQTTSNELIELLQTDAFVRAVIQQTDLEQKMSQGTQAVKDTISEVRKDVSVTILGDNQIQVSASYENSKIASQIASGVIDGYIKWQSNSKRAESEAALAFFGNLIVSYQADLDNARAAMKSYLEAHPTPIRGDVSSLDQLEIKRLQSDIDLAYNRYSSALDKEENARLALSQIDSNAHQTYILIDAPQPSLKPNISLKQVGLKSGIFLVVGVILSIVAVGGAMVLDRTFLMKVDVANVLSLPVLAMVPYVTPQGSDKKQKKKLRDRARENKVEDEREGISLSNLTISHPNTPAKENDFNPMPESELARVAIKTALSSQTSEQGAEKTSSQPHVHLV